MGQYTAEFRSSRISEGGTYWSVGDTALEGPPFISNPAVPRGESFQGDKGDVALGLKWSPPALDGDAIGAVGTPLRRQDADLAEPGGSRSATARASAAPSTRRTSTWSAWPTTPGSAAWAPASS